MTDAVINSFHGGYRFLSNFYPATVQFDGVTFPSVEHAYQAAKTLNPAERSQILNAATPKLARQLGQKVTLRKDWEEIKLDIMLSLLRRKFFDHSELGQLLLSTGEAELVEGNNWGDVWWGRCRGEGENHLGKLLMQVRAELREKSSD